jgi:septal ring factor EnvC (AmiA/AmiB activator)
MGVRAQVERWRRTGSVVCAVLLLIGAALVVRSWLDTRHATRRTSADLRSTQSELAEASGDLSLAHDSLATAESRLREELATLSTREDERAEAEASLEAISLLLSDLEAQLTAAEADLATRTARREAFSRCLLAVVELLNQASVSDSHGLNTTLQRIDREGSCAEAGVAL